MAAERLPGLATNGGTDDCEVEDGDPRGCRGVRPNLLRRVRGHRRRTQLPGRLSRAGDQHRDVDGPDGPSGLLRRRGRARRRGRREQLPRRTQPDRRRRADHRRPVGAERRRRTPAHGRRARTGGGPRLRRCPAAAGRLPLPVALPVRVARFRHSRAGRRRCRARRRPSPFLGTLRGPAPRTTSPRPTPCACGSTATIAVAS